MRIRSTIAARSSLAAWLGLAACHPAPTPPVEPAPLAEPTATEPTASPSEPAPCGPVGERFDDHAWVPAAATTVASVQLDAPELSPALHALGEHARAPGHGLPIPLAFSLGQWAWQVPTLVAALRRAGLHPGELVFLSDDANDHAWVWRSTCDLDETIERIEAAWSVRSRRVVEGVVATPSAAADDDAIAFPYDVLMLPGERMALVPAGRASTALARFAHPAPSASLGGTPMRTAGHRLDELDPAAVRLVFLGRALLDPGTVAIDHAPQRLRITGAGVQHVIDGPPPSPAAARASPDPADDASLRPAP